MTDLSIDNSVTPFSSSIINNVSEEKSENELNQSDFIELLVAQVKNQDPTKPMDPSQFMTQLTQSTMVNGLQNMQTSFDELSTKLTSDQSLKAAGLVGKSVLLPGGQGLLTSGETISGEISLEQQSSNVNLVIYNIRGEQVRTLPLGGHDAGTVQFKWDGFADDGSISPPGNYLVTADASINGNQQGVEVLLENRIYSISINQGSDDSLQGTLLNLSNGQSVSLDDVRRIK